MKKAGERFDALINQIDRYILEMAPAIHNDNAKMIRDGLEEMIKDGRLARKRDVALQERAAKKRAAEKFQHDHRYDPRPLSEIYAEEEAKRGGLK